MRSRAVPFRTSFVLLLATVLACQGDAPPGVTDRTLPALTSASIKKIERDGVPRVLYGLDVLRLAPQAFVDWYRNEYDLSIDDELRAAPARRMPNGIAIHPYFHYRGGVPVTGSQLTIYARNGIALVSVGRVHPDLRLDDMASLLAIPKERVQDVAIRALTDARHSIDASRASAPQPTIRFSDRGEPQIVGVVSVPARGSAQRYRVAVDLRTLTMRGTIDDGVREDWQPAQGGFERLYTDQPVLEPALQVESALNNDGTHNYRLSSLASPYRTVTRDLDGKDGAPLDLDELADFELSADACDSADYETCVAGVCMPYFSNATCPKNKATQELATAHGLVQRAQNLFANAFGLDGLDSDHKGVAVLLHRGADPLFVPNAWAINPELVTGSNTLYGIMFTPEGAYARSLVADPSVVGHEYGHLVVHSLAGDHSVPNSPNAGLIDSPTSGLLNEGIADIMGALVASSTIQGGIMQLGPIATWLHGNKPLKEPTLMTGVNCSRNLEHPGFGAGYPNDPVGSTLTTGCKETLFPNTQYGANWLFDELDGRYAHDNGVVISSWFYWLVNGCDPAVKNCQNSATPPDSYAITPILLADAAAILLGAVQALPHEAQLADLSEFTVALALATFGEHSPQHRAVVDAWYAVNVGETYVPPAIYPAADDMSVEPWPAELWFQVTATCPTGHTVWIGTDPNQLKAVTQPIKYKVINNKQVGSLVLNLHPDTDYYWRVNNPATPSSCGGQPLAPVARFHTKLKQTLPIAPTLKEPKPGTGDDKACPQDPIDGKYHPWHLIFEWDPVIGATDYRIEVASDAEFAQQLKFAKPTSSTTTITLDVLSDKRLHWRVVPIGPPSELDGANPQPAEGKWAADEFETRLPETQLTTQSPTAPWPARFTWDEVCGAIGYNVWLEKNGEEYWKREYPDFEEKAELPLYLAAQWDHYRVGLQPIGPEIEWAGMSELQLGKHATSADLAIDPTSTFVELLEPTKVPQDNCMYPGTTSTLYPTAKWQQVEGVSKYELRSYEWHCQSPPCSRGAPDNTKTIAHVEGQSVGDGNVVTTLPFDHVSSRGVEIEVVGFAKELGPNGEQWTSFCTNSAHCFDDLEAVFDSADVTFAPQIPRLISPAHGQTFENSESGQITLTWESDYAPGGAFVTELFDDDDCQGGAEQGESLIKNHLSGTYSWFVNFEGDQPRWKGWYIRPSGTSSNCTADYSYKSECHKFKINGSQPPPAPVLTAPQDGEIVTIQLPDLCWKEVSGATHYEVSLERPNGTLDVKTFTPGDLHPGSHGDVCVFTAPDDPNNPNPIMCGIYQYTVRARRETLWGPQASPHAYDIEHDSCDAQAMGPRGRAVMTASPPGI